MGVFVPFECIFHLRNDNRVAEDKLAVQIMYLKPLHLV